MARRKIAEIDVKSLSNDDEDAEEEKAKERAERKVLSMDINNLNESLKEVCKVLQEEAQSKKQLQNQIDDLKKELVNLRTTISSIEFGSNGGSNGITNGGGKSAPKPLLKQPQPQPQPEKKMTKSSQSNQLRLQAASYRQEEVYQDSEPEEPMEEDELPPEEPMEESMEETQEEESPEEGQNQPEESEEHYLEKIRTKVYEGYLDKKAEFGHTWKTRYFVLYEGGPLLYYDHSPQSNDSAKGVIALENAKLFQKAEMNGITKPLLFNIRSTNRDFLIRAPSQEEKTVWCNRLKDNIIQFNSGKAVIQRSGSMAVSRDQMEQYWENQKRLQLVEEERRRKEEESKRQQDPTQKKQLKKIQPSSSQPLPSAAPKITPNATTLKPATPTKPVSPPPARGPPPTKNPTKNLHNDTVDLPEVTRTRLNSGNTPLLRAQSET